MEQYSGSQAASCKHSQGQIVAVQYRVSEKDYRITENIFKISRKFHRSKQNFDLDFYIKDIVQPKKRGVKRGMNRLVLTSYTIADVFFEHLKG
jgi:hypothetical protein